jgi:hypothetical protein
MSQQIKSAARVSAFEMGNQAAVAPRVRGRRRRVASALIGAATAAAALTTATAVPALGAIKNWTAAGGGNWSAPGNWNGGTQPVNADTVNLTFAGLIVRTIVYDAGATATSLAGLTIDDSGGGVPTLQIPNIVKTLTLTANEVIGSTATGHAFLQQDGATHILNAGTTLTLGMVTAGSGTYTMNGGTATFPNVVVAQGGTGIIQMNGGTVNVNGAGGSDALTLANGANTSAGNIFMSGGTINVTATGGLVVGKSNVGQVDQSGGSVVVGTGGSNKNLLLGVDVGDIANNVQPGNGSYAVYNTGSLTVNGSVYVGGTNAGPGGTGSFSVGDEVGGICTITGTLKIWNTSSTTAQLADRGTLSVGALDTSGDPSLFNWSNGTLNITGGGLNLSLSGPLGESLFLPDGKNLSVSGAVTLSATSSLQLAGGSLTATTFTGAGTHVDFTSGNLNLTASGITLEVGGTYGASVSIPAGSSITVSGAQLNNGTVNMSGGSFGGATALTNNGVITGSGALTGAGGITNNGLIMLSGGNLIISKTGTFANASGGVVQLDAGRQLQLNTGNMTNDGTIDLDGGGTINSTSGAQLINNVEGLITGSGTIAVPLTNNGTLAVPSGSLNVNNAFNNGGIVQLGSITSKILVGGAGLTNSSTGIVQGVGRLSGTVNNSGRIEAIGGTLQLAGTTNNLAGGTLAASTSNQILITGTVGANAGMISLTGGTLDTNHQGLTNSASGIITGRGTLRTGGITNNGQILLGGGNTDIYGALTGNNASKVILSGGGNAYLYDPVTMNAGSLFRVGSGSTAAFFGNVNGASFFDGAGVKDFEAGVSNVGALITPGTTQVQTGATLNTTVIRESSLYLGGTATVAANGGPSATSNLGTLTIPLPGQGKLDLKDNDLVIQNASLGSWTGTQYTGVTGLLASGRTTGNTWNGSGIISSNAGASGGLTSLGVVTADQIGKAGGIFSGQNVASGNILVAYTYGGDANLDGKLNVDDYGRIDSNIGLGTTGWYNGDFNYDGKVNVDDYGILDSNIGVQGPPLISGAGVLDTSGASALGVSAVPEPGSAALLLIGAGAYIVKRRRSPRC